MSTRASTERPRSPIGSSRFAPAPTSPSSAGSSTTRSARNRFHDEYVRLFTNASFLVSEKYAFDEKRGVFAGWDVDKKAYTDKSSWNYELDASGFAKVDATLEHPRSVFQVMKRFYARYTPEMVSTICGCSPEDFLDTAELITSTHTPDRVGTIMYALGWTHHSHSVQLIHAAACCSSCSATSDGRAGASTRFVATPTFRAALTAAWPITTCPATFRYRRPITRRWALLDGRDAEAAAS